MEAVPSSSGVPRPGEWKEGEVLGREAAEAARGKEQAGLWGGCCPFSGAPKSLAKS